MVWDRQLGCVLAFVLVTGFQASADDLTYEVQRGDPLLAPAVLAESADSLAQKSRQLLSECLVKSGCEDETVPQTAEDLARRALILDESHIEARLQLAISISMQARNMSIGKARKEKVAEAMRDFAESVLVDDPDNAWAHGFLAVWHVEVRRRGGVIGAAIMGASLKKAEAHFQAVLRVAPDNLVLRWQYARALAALDAKRHDTEILSQLNIVSTSTCADKIERAVQKRALYLADAIRHQKFADAETFANTQM